jgi:hypothetical protein
MQCNDSSSYRKRQCCEFRKRWPNNREGIPEKMAAFKIA